MSFGRPVAAAAVLAACAGCFTSSALDVSETRRRTPTGSQLQLGVGLQVEFAVHVDWQKDYWLWWRDDGEDLPSALSVKAAPPGAVEVVPAGATERLDGSVEPGNPAPNADLVHFTPSVAGPGELTFEDPSADGPAVVRFDARVVDDVTWGTFDAVEPSIFVGSTKSLYPSYRGAGSSLLGVADLGIVAPAGSGTTVTRVEASSGPSFSIAVGPAPHDFQVTTPAIDAPLTMHAVADDAIQGIGLSPSQEAGVQVAVGATVLVPVEPLDAQGFPILGKPQAKPSLSASGAVVSLVMSSDDAFWLKGQSAGDAVATIAWAGATRQVAIHVVP